MNELSTILVTIISSVIPLIGGGALFFHKQNKKLKEAEASLAEVNVDKAKVETKAAEYDNDQRRYDSLHKVIDTLNQQLADTAERAAKDKQEHDKVVDDKIKRIREKDDEILRLNEKLLTKEQYISTLRLYVNWLIDWHCEREEGTAKEDCNRRKPKQKVKMCYNAPAGLDDLLKQKVDSNPLFVKEINKTVKEKA